MPKTSLKFQERIFLIEENSSNLLPPSFSTHFKKIEEDLRLPADHKSKGLLQGLQNYEEKPKVSLVYLIGLLVIFGILIRLFSWHQILATSALIIQKKKAVGKSSQPLLFFGA